LFENLADGISLDKNLEELSQPQAVKRFVAAIAMASEGSKKSHMTT